MMPTKPNRTRAISQPAGRQRTHAPGAPRPLASLQPIPTPASRGPPLHPPNPLACRGGEQKRPAGVRALPSPPAQIARDRPLAPAPRSHASPSCALRPRVAIPSTTVRGNGAGSLAAHPQPRGEAKAPARQPAAHEHTAGPFGRAPAPIEKDRAGAGAGGADFVALCTLLSRRQSYLYSFYLLRSGAVPPLEHLVRLR